MNNYENRSSLSLRDILAELLENSELPLSARELSDAIEELTRARASAAKREKEEHRQREKEEAERRKREAEEQKAAHIQAVTSMELPLDWENVFNSDVRTQGVHAESIPDGLIRSLQNLGRVDIEYISSITGADYKTVIGALKGSIYQNPETWYECFFRGWETAEEYLSGNLMRKWKAAKKANEEYRGYFQDNIDALEKALPESVPAEDIYITLGSPWIPTDIIDDFITHLLKLKTAFSGTVHDEYTGAWEIPRKSVHKHNVRSAATFGTSRIGALYILEHTLNMKTISITDEVANPLKPDGKKRVVNQSETMLALQRQQKMNEEFRKWVWRDENRKKRLETIFEENFSCVRRRIFDGAFLEFPTMSPDITLYPYQKNAVARILFSPNTLLAHDVGSGKTYIMIAAGMELRRTGLSKKNLYVVPNNIVSQWRDIFKLMYPDASVLCIEPRTFVPAKRESVLKEIRDSDYDGIIMAYSCFEQIPLSKDFYLDELEARKAAITELAKNSSKATSRLKKKKEAVQKAIAELNAAVTGLYDTVYFDELGITRLFVDEAHNFKNVPIGTQTGGVLGISPTGSKKCRDMMDKVHQVQKQNAGGGVVMATGTPITNSITDAFVMQQYLQSGELALLDLQSFDGWIGMFAEKVTEFEVDVDTSSYRLATRFAKFHNLPELTALLSSVADFHQVDSTAGVPDFDGYKDALIGRTQGFEDYLKDISRRAEDVRKGCVPRTEDNMLKITTDGRKAALDLRLADPSAGFTWQSKVARCAENVFDIYRSTQLRARTQLIFCDTSTPKQGFNIYDELKRLLVNMGVPEEAIAYIHDAETERSRTWLFGKVRRGEVRILIGSTFKLGLGVNIQDKLIALHHLDVPWRPADMTQREGRILRQGNENPKVYIYRYITEGSFDAYSWQLLETKQRFITGLLSGSLSERSGSDIESTVLNYAEVKALAVGNPLVKERVETANSLSRYLTLQKKAVETRLRLEREQAELPGRIEYQRQIMKKCVLDHCDYKRNYRKHTKEERKAIREQLYSGVQDNVLETREKTLMTYQGFEVILPANMRSEKPYIWLQRNGRYYVELGDSETGMLIRVDNFLEGFGEHRIKLAEALEDLSSRMKSVQAELEKGESYTDEIQTCIKRLEKLDKKLGVDKK